MKCIKMGTVLVSLLLVISFLLSCSKNGDKQPWFEPLGKNADWQPQDYVDSQGIKAVHLEGGRLVLEAHLIGQHPNYNKGEVFLDIRYFPGLEGSVPIDLSQSKITVEVEVPNAFDGWESSPNGVQVFVKDHEWRSQYGTWENITKGGKYKATLSPTTGQIRWGYTEPGFDPTKIRIIGVKFAIGTNSSAIYDGPLYVTKISVKPPLALSPPPTLPLSTPLPVFVSGDKIEVKSDGFYLNNRKWFMVGGNWRILEYGQNFGTTAWFPTGNGISKHPNFVRVNLDYFRRAGIKVVRVGLLEDGRTMFDKEGYVTGYNETFRKDVKTFLDLADGSGIKVEFTIFDYLIAGRTKNVEGVWVRGRSKIITDNELKGEFINKFLISFLKDFGHHPTLISFDVINEPEWIVSKKDGGDWESVKDLKTKADTSIPGQTMKDFITECINTIHKHSPGKLVTVGISSKFIPLVKNLNIDYFALHHYPWMGELRDYLPLLPKGKPWSLEEYPTNGTSISISGYLDLVLKEGGTGAMMWNLSPGIDEFTFTHVQQDSKLQELRSWIDRHRGDILKVVTTSPPLPQPVPTPSTSESYPAKPAPDRPAAIGSPYGSVPFGEKAYSPDGKMYAREVEPRDHGNIGIFDLITDKRLKIMDVRQHPAGDYPNDLKGLAWSPDSKWLAVMYHHDGGGHISILKCRYRRRAQVSHYKKMVSLYEIFLRRNKNKGGW